MRWIGVATVILLIGGAGGFWLLNKDGDKKTTEQTRVETTHTATQPTAQIVATVVNEYAIKDPVKDPPKPAIVTSKVEITTIPEGATVSVEGTELSAPSPASFELPEGEPFKVSISHAGFVTQTLDLVADGSPIKATTLVAMTKWVRFTSQPSGALVTVNGQRLKGLTPIDMPLSATLASKPTLKVRMILAGHKALVASLTTSDEYVEEKDQLVMTFSGTLVRVPPGKRPRKKPTVKDPDEKDPDEGKTPKDLVPDTKPDDPTPKDPGDNKDPEPFKPKTQPIPDWMK